MSDRNWNLIRPTPDTCLPQRALGSYSRWVKANKRATLGRERNALLVGIASALPFPILLKVRHYVTDLYHHEVGDPAAQAVGYA